MDVVDACDPTSPVIVGCIDTPGNDVAVSGSYAYLASKSVFQVVDIPDPASLQAVPSIALWHGLARALV